MSEPCFDCDGRGYRNAVGHEGHLQRNACARCDGSGTRQHPSFVYDSEPDAWPALVDGIAPPRSSIDVHAEMRAEIEPTARLADEEFVPRELYDGLVAAHRSDMARLQEVEADLATRALALDEALTNKVQLLRDAITRAEAAEAREAKLRAALERICASARRTDLHGNGALWDLVEPYLINEARAVIANKEA